MEQMYALCPDCNQDHSDQRTRFPVGVKVQALNDFGNKFSAVKAASLGEVIGHCDDGRAQFRFSTSVHTFHYPYGYVSLIDDTPQRHTTEMTLPQYQAASKRTMPQPIALDGDKSLLAYLTLGIAGETGEIVEHLKKFVWHNHELNKGYIQKEVGDVFWYLSALCSVVGLDLEDVARVNVEKLKLRYPDGYSHERSQNRTDTTSES